MALTESDVKDLERIVRSTEKQTKQPTQVVITIGQNQYVFADLTKRRGIYSVELETTYWAPNQPVPNQELAREYDSFEALQRAFLGKTLEVHGSRKQGFTIAIHTHYSGRPETPQYATVGRIIYPLLQKGEPVKLTE